MPAVFWLSFPRLLEFLTRTKAMRWLRIFITYRPYKKQKAIIVILDYLLKRQLFKKKPSWENENILHFDFILTYSVFSFIHRQNLKQNKYLCSCILFITIKLKIWYNG